MRSALLAFLMITLFVVSLGVLLLELTLTRLFSIILWYDYAFMVISIAFFGLGIGSLLVHILKNKLNKEDLPSKILQSTMAFAISIPIMLLIIGHFVPPSVSVIYIFYLSSSIPFFFAGISVAMIYLCMPKEITKLYFLDLLGAGAAALVLDPIIQALGAESVLLSISVIVVGPSLAGVMLLFRHRNMYANNVADIDNVIVDSVANRIKIFGFIILVSAALLLSLNISTNVFAIGPGISKGLHYQLAKPLEFQHLSTQWNSFSRIDVTKQIHRDPGTEDGPLINSGENTGRFRALASIIIDADADTPVFGWNGSYNDILWVRQYMDYLPYELLKVNSSLVIGSGGGEDVLIALAGGSKNITAVELNPLIISKAKEFGKSAGNLYDREEVEVFIDDGRRFTTSSSSKYDIITIKLVDSWAAQLAGGYALSENYLYTVEAFRQYLQHLDGDSGMLVMVRWNIELPRLMPLLVESLRQETGKSIQEVSNQIMVVEDRPGLYFGANDKRTIYPVLVMLKNNPFTASQIRLVTERVRENDAQVFAIPGVYTRPPYDELLMVSSGSAQRGSKGQDIQDNIENIKAITELKPPTDDSPFFFAKEKIPSQLIILLITVLSVAGVLALLLAYYSRINNIRLASSSLSWLLVLFAIFIGLGFMVIEITFIQKFLLLLGTPIMALTVILFSILVSSGVGAYLSGKLFRRSPHIGVITSIPLLIAIVIIYYYLLQDIISSNMSLEIHYRIGLTFALLAPAGLLMGFQFPSIIRLSSIYAQKYTKQQQPSVGYRREDITLLWGVNVIASVIGTVLTAILSMIIGFSGNLLVGAGLYFGAFMAVVISLKMAKTMINREIIK